MPSERTYSADQIATAARELRQAAGAGPEAFTAAQAVSMLSDEVRMLRERGFSDERIAALFSSYDIDVTPDDLRNSGENSWESISAAREA